ncbi:MAG TPA: protease inhibitor I42 family protein [Steroidobacteraceae bacterium]|nr:protease inhibitor I42 family protein [Steroidobacteraceae bacterium]
MKSMHRYDEDATEVTVAVGDSFVLELRALATAGFTWSIATMPDLLVLRDERIGPTRSALGAPSVQEFEFRATRPGSGTLAMQLARHWESTPAEIRELTVVVTGVS